MEFCHLHVHTENSLLDGYGSAKQYLSKAKELGFQYLACTDHGNQDGLIKFQREAEKQGIKSILGCELYIVPDASIKVPKEFRFHVTVLVKDNDGWHNLCKILTEANLHGFYYKPRADFDMLKKYSKGLVFLSGCTATVLTSKIGQDFFWELNVLCPGDCYLEVMPHLFDDQMEVNKICCEYGLPLVATNDCHYVNEDDGMVHEVLLAIQTKAKWSDSSRFRFETRGLFLRSSQEMKEAFKLQDVLTKSQYLLAMRNTVEIAEKCSDFKIQKQDIFLPSILQKGESENLFLRTLCEKGYRKIFGELIENDSIYYDRFLEEFNMIKKKKFIRYFLVVWELTEWCKKNNIMIGPGRGSVGGSLIAYLIGITSVDPIKYNLLFSRFIAEDRIDYPDIDLDFEDVKRPLIRGHLEEMYGKNNIASVSTFMDMKGRAAIRDVARVFEIPYGEVDEFAKFIEDENGDGSSIETAASDHWFSQKYPEAVKIAIRLEGQTRGVGQHAAALIVSADDLTQGARCNLSVRSNQEVVNWDKDDAEYVGLMKLDVLGLNTLSILNETKRLVKENHNKEIVFEKITLDNPQVFDMLSKGQTVGVFQFNTWPTTKLCKEVGVDSFGLMSDVVALVRPGPADSGMTADFIKRKHGKKWLKKHRIYEQITRDTFGIIIYQEQVMQVISEVAGLPYSTADKIRKIIAKKRDVKEFEKYREMFVDGCEKKETLSEKEALEFWEALEKHASYSFNRCLAGDTVVNRASAGRFCGLDVTLKDLYESRYSKTSTGDKLRCRGLHLLQWKELDSRIHTGKMTNIYDSGVQEVWLICLESGNSIKATDQHRFLAKRREKNLYVKVCDLKIGDLLAIKGPRVKEIIKAALDSRPLKTTYRGRGFQKGEDNVGYIDGRGKFLKPARIKVSLRARGRCEECGKEIEKECESCHQKVKIGRPEFAHVKLLDELNYDHELYHSLENIMYLCNSCHKKKDYEKGERKVRHSVGRIIEYSPIKSIKYVGKEQTYDVEMEDPHNFIANGFVSHNSHSVEYSMIAYWCAFCKLYFPAEFLCANLSYGSDGKKEELVKEARRLGLNIVLPKIGVSDAHKWVVKDGKLYVPFIEIKGVGEKVALELLKYRPPEPQEVVLHQQSKPRQRGFFDLKQEEPKTVLKEVKEKKIDKLLKAIGAIGNNPEEDLSKYFSFDMSVDKRDEFPNLRQCLGFSFPPKDLEAMLSLELPVGYIRGKIHTSKFQNPELLYCQDCDLVKQCKRPVLPSSGRYNLAIVGEAPGPNEDKQGEGFVGRAGDLVWKELGQYGLIRRFFHVTNCVKCYPGEIKTPAVRHLTACKKWLDEEIKQAEIKLSLVFGNTGLKYFKGEDGGITKYSGKAEWLENYGMWACWCVHPASVLRDPKNKDDFQSGIANFVEKINVLGGLK